MLYLLYNILFVLMQSQLGKTCTTKSNVFIRLFAYVVLMRLQQNKKPAPPTTISSALSKILMYVHQSDSCGNAKSCIFSVSVKHCASPRKNSTAKTSTHSIPDLISVRTENTRLNASHSKFKKKKGRICALLFFFFSYGPLLFPSG